jgi:hypothetical protein
MENKGKNVKDFDLNTFNEDNKDENKNDIDLIELEYELMQL